MKLIQEKSLKILIPEEGYFLKDKEDNYKEAYVDEQGNEIEEYFPYLFKKAYVPENMTVEQAKELYEEVEEGVENG